MPEKYDKPKFEHGPKFKPALTVDQLRELDLRTKGNDDARLLLWEVYRLHAVIQEMRAILDKEP